MQKRINGCVFRYVLLLISALQLGGCAELQEPAHGAEVALRTETARFERETAKALVQLVHTREPVTEVRVVPAVRPPMRASIPAPRGAAFLAVALNLPSHPSVAHYKVKIERQAIAAAYVYRADRSEARHDDRGAIDALRRSLALEPSSSIGWFRLAGLQRQTNDLASAAASLDLAVQSDPQNDAARLARAEVEQRLERFAAALSDFNAYRARHGDSPNVLRLEIDAARAANDHSAALAAIDAYLAIVPDDSAILRARGDELYAAGSENAAIAAWKIYVERTPDDVDVLRRIAYASEHAGDFTSAVGALTEYVRQRPGDDRVRLALAYDEARLGRTELATAAFKDLRDSSDPDVASQAAAELRARMTGSPRSSRVGYGTLEYDSRFHDVIFGADVYALAPAGRFQPYLTIHSWDDTRSSARAYEPVIYNDNAEIFGGGVRYYLGSSPGRYFFAESGEQFSLIGRGNSPELRYGFASWSEAGQPGRGHTSYGFSVASYSRYGADVIGYGNVLHDFPLTPAVRGVFGTNFAFDTHREYWNNVGEIELGVKIGSPRFAVTLAGVGGWYLPRGAFVPAKPFYTTLRPSITWSPRL